MNHEYRIIEDNADDPTAIRIEKANITVDFTIADMIAEQRELERYLTQFKAQDQIEQAKIENVARNHPSVVDLSPVERTAARLYQEASEDHDKLALKIPEFEKQLAESKAELATICERLGIRLRSNDAIVEEAVAKIIDHGE